MFINRHKPAALLPTPLHPPLDRSPIAHMSCFKAEDFEVEGKGQQSSSRRRNTLSPRSAKTMILAVIEDSDEDDENEAANDISEEEKEEVDEEEDDNHITSVRVDELGFAAAIELDKGVAAELLEDAELKYDEPPVKETHLMIQTIIAGGRTPDVAITAMDLIQPLPQESDDLISFDNIQDFPSIPYPTYDPFDFSLNGELCSVGAIIPMAPDIQTTVPRAESTAVGMMTTSPLKPSLAEQEQRARERFYYRMQQAQWKYAWEMTSAEAVEAARKRKR